MVTRQSRPPPQEWVATRPAASPAPKVAVEQRRPGLATALAAGNRATTMLIQRRESRAEARRWVQRLLSRGSSIDASGLAAAAAHLRGWSADRQVHLLRRLRRQIDSFEVALGNAGTLLDPNAGRVIGILEAAQTNSALGTRLVTLFNASVHPAIGFVIAANIDQDRVRTVLETNVRATMAMGTLLRRNPQAGTPASLRGIRGTIAGWETEFTDTTGGGVTASDAARETNIENILTPAAVANARAAAASAGAPPPSFEPANYYEDLLAGLHATMLSAWGWAEPEEARDPLDASPGGHIEGIATEAKTRVDALFGDYGSRPAPALTFAAGNLEDRGTIAGDAFDMARWFIREGSGTRPAIQAAKDAHHSFEDTTGTAEAIENRLIAHYSGRSAPAIANEQAAISGLSVGTAERTRRLLIIDRMWPGVQTRGTVSVAAREGATRRETRSVYWGLFKTMIHEYLHTTEHAAYQTWYHGLRDSHHETTYQEGFTDLFTLKTWRSLFPHEIAANVGLRRRIQGPSDPRLDMRAVGGPPGHYAQLAEAEQIEQEIGVANMKAAYFRGQTSVLGGARLPR